MTPIKKVIEYVSTGRARKLASALFFLAVFLASAAAWAGPPFQTDDPEPIDYKNYEFYTFGLADGTGDGTATMGPAVEFNYGPLPNVHLHIIVPLAASFPAGGPRTVGLGDIETGVKFRFIQETKRRPQIGTFVMFELPAGNADKGLGVGKTWYKVPLWAQKSFGPWTTYGGGGENIVKGVPGLRSFPFAGGLLQRDIGKKWTLGTEVFYHGSPDAEDPRAWATMVDIGGYYKFRDPGFQLLFCYGHTVAGKPETYAYLGLYWTWGKQSDTDKKDDSSAMNRLMRPGALGRL